MDERHIPDTSCAKTTAPWSFLTSKSLPLTSLMTSSTLCSKNLIEAKYPAVHLKKDKEGRKGKKGEGIARHGETQS